MTVVDAIMRGARNAVENPIPFKIPSVAAPHPYKVNGPRNSPSGARAQKIMVINRVL